MVKYNPKVWFSIIFHSYSGYVVRMLTPALIFLTVFAALVSYIFLDPFWLNLHNQEFKSEIIIHQLLGIVLGLFLVFRVNTAYDRWWEGRKLWGSMVNNTRNLSFKFAAYLPADDQVNRNWFAMMIANVPFALRDLLRNRSFHKDLEYPEESIRAAVEGNRHAPNVLSTIMYRKMEQMKRDGKLSADQLWLLDREMKEFADIVGACERIRNTPIPYSFSMFIKKFIFLYLFTLPFGLVTTLEYLTIPVVFLVSYILLSVELIAEEIEDPFGKDINDLPTDELSAKMRFHVKAILLGQGSTGPESAHESAEGLDNQV